MSILWRLRALGKSGHRLLSTVEAGTAYENQAVATLNQLGASLERVGGASDHGIDFCGLWKLPSHREFYVVGQCKHYERKKIGPSILREWEGVMSRQELDTLGIVVATSGFTPSGIHAALSSAYPVALVTMASPLKRVEHEPPYAESAIRGFVWNRAAEPFLGRLVVAKKHYDVQMVDLDDPAAFTIQLFWDGKPLTMAPPCLDPPPSSLD
ncbi:hypothetical protein IWW49_001121 [Coemansia sp. RSA 1797]|nr:hypothetical protein IWW49_001121 [Coemansia sp. RSA 1797]